MRSSGEQVFQHDRVMLTKNHYGLDVRNGHLGTVVDVQFTPGPLRRPLLKVTLDERQDLATGDKKNVTLRPGDYPHVQLGYAATTHKVAGITVENAYVLLGDSMVNKEIAFTQLTRASHNAVIYGAEARYGDALDSLAQQMKMQTAKELAHDFTLVQQPVKHVQREKQWMQEAVGVLAPRS